MHSSILALALSSLSLCLAGCADATAVLDTDGAEDTAQASGEDASEDEGSSETPATEDLTPGSTDEELPSGAEILEALGAEGVAGADPDAVAGYRTMFERLDANGDSIVTVEEYIESGHFSEEKARAIFAASDRDQDGEMTEDEYVENRIITDEAKLIFAELDTNQDETLIESEFVDNAPFEPAVGAGVYGLFDMDGDGAVMVPEYLMVWGAWARGELAPESM